MADDQSPGGTMRSSNASQSERADSKDTSAAVAMSAMSATKPPASQSGEAIVISAPSSQVRFRDLGEIARGGMGTVRRVFDTVLRREVAMKLCDQNAPSYTQTSMRFMEEAQITGQLDHPNIVAVHDLGMDPSDAGVFFTMKLVEGETLAAHIRKLHAAPYDHRAIERVLGVFLKVCDALAFAHMKGVVHRDLKPENVMVGSHGQVFLMDWGVALLRAANPIDPGGPGQVTLSDDLARDTRDDGGAIVGTFEYMAPEQAWGRSRSIDARTDVFGLGGILYQLLTGRGPNAAENSFEALQLAQRGRPSPPESVGAWPSLPPGLCRIAMRALAKSPDERYSSVSLLREDVEDFLRGGGWFDSCNFAAGSPIVEQGSPADSAYIIVSGRCDVQKTTNGRGSVLRRLGPGDVFGETAVLTGEPRTATVVAIDDVIVKVVTRDALEREFDRASWSGAFVKALADRFRDVDEKLAALRDQSACAATRAPFVGSVAFAEGAGPDVAPGGETGSGGASFAAGSGVPPGSF